MDEIKLPPGFGPISHPSADTTDAKPNRNFSVTGNESVSSPASAPGLAAASGLSKLDLRDPAKLDGIVRSSVTEIVEAQTGSLPISSSDKKALIDFLSEDPLFRQRIESYLRKALP